MSFFSRLFGTDSRNDTADEIEVIRHEEQLNIGTEAVPAGTVRAHKRWERQVVDATAPRFVQFFDGVDHQPPAEHVSIPILEERLVISRETFVRERIILRRRQEDREVTIRARLRHERVEVDADDDARAYDDTSPGGGQRGEAEGPSGSTRASAKRSSR